MSALRLKVRGFPDLVADDYPTLSRAYLARGRGQPDGRIVGSVTRRTFARMRRDGRVFNWSSGSLIYEPIISKP